jgi:hypothetical protein
LRAKLFLSSPEQRHAPVLPMRRSGMEVRGSWAFYLIISPDLESKKLKNAGAMDSFHKMLQTDNDFLFFNPFV